jgi:hypothetical protein
MITNQREAPSQNFARFLMTRGVVPAKSRKTSCKDLQHQAGNRQSPPSLTLSLRLEANLPMMCRTLFSLCLASALLLSACGTDDGTKSDASTTTDVSGGDSTVEIDGQDGSSVDGVSGDDATQSDSVESDGTGGDTTVVGEPGPSAGGFVSGGGVMSSPKFRLLSTVGVPDQSILTSKSTTYRLQGGLIGSIGVNP